MNKVVVVGAGAWGTALAVQALRAGHDVTLVTRSEAAALEINDARENRRLPGIRLPNSLSVSSCIPGRPNLLLWATPTQYLRRSLSRFGPVADAIAVCAKGVEAETHRLPFEIVEAASHIRPIAVLSGPNFAFEIAQGRPAAAVVASTDAACREAIKAMLGTSTFRIYGSGDPLGVSLGGAAKNVIAIAAGAVIGAGLGENARAALVTRGLSEICQMTVALGGRAQTAMGLSGLGDLILTCTGPTSRNFSLGLALGQGRTLLDVLAERSNVTEGVKTAAALVARAGNIDLPICRAVSEFLAGTKTLEQSIEALLSRPQRDE